MKWPLVWRSTASAEYSRGYGDGYVEAARVADKFIAAEQSYSRATHARIRAEVRAEEWEAIARELISRGAGRPHADVTRTKDIVAEAIRDASGGDAKLAQHYWQNVVAPARRDKKSDEDIVGLIGWTSDDPLAEAPKASPP